MFPVFVLVLKHFCAHQLCITRVQTLCLSQRIWLCLCVVYVCMCTPTLKYFSHSPSIPNGTAGEQKLGRALPVLFWTSWLHWRGCQSSQPFPPIHPAEPQPLPPRLHLCVQMMWTNTVYRPVTTRWLYFSSSLFPYFYTCTLCVSVSSRRRGLTNS